MTSIARNEATMPVRNGPLLGPVLGFFIEDGWERCCERAIELLNYGGLGHSLGIHSQDQYVIDRFFASSALTDASLALLETLDTIDLLSVDESAISDAGEQRLRAERYQLVTFCHSYRTEDREHTVNFSQHTGQDERFHRF